MKTEVVWHKNQNQFMMYPYMEMQVYCFCVGIFHSSFGLMKYPYTKTIHLHLQKRIHNSLVLVIILWQIQRLVISGIVYMNLTVSFETSNIVLYHYILCFVCFFLVFFLQFIALFCSYSHSMVSRACH